MADAINRKRDSEAAVVAHSRGQGGAGEPWKPRTRYRKDTFLWACQLDHQMKVGCGIGLRHFQQPEDLRERGHWSTWPLLSYAGNQGPKEERGKNYLKHAAFLNFDESPDTAHGCWNDCKLGLKYSGHWTHIAVMMLLWNVPHGPWGEDKRFHETRACLKSFFERIKKPQDSPLFRSLLDRMDFDQQDPALSARDELSSLLLDRLKAATPWSTKSAKVNLNKFMSAVKAGLDTAADWTFTYFAYLQVCLDQGYLTEAKYRRAKVKADAVEERGTGEAKAGGAEAALRRACQKQMVVAALMLAETTTQYRQRGINEVLRPYLRWHEQQAHELRSTDDNLKCSHCSCCTIGFQL